MAKAHRSGVPKEEDVSRNRSQEAGGPMTDSQESTESTAHTVMIHRSPQPLLPLAQQLSLAHALQPSEADHGSGITHLSNSYMDKSLVFTP